LRKATKQRKNLNQKNSKTKNSSRMSRFIRDEAIQLKAKFASLSE